jgi:hypothetical protein
VWVDPVILKAKKWGSAEIERRTRLLAQDAYKHIWSIKRKLLTFKWNLATGLNFPVHRVCRPSAPSDGTLEQGGLLVPPCSVDLLTASEPKLLSQRLRLARRVAAQRNQASSFHFLLSTRPPLTKRAGAGLHLLLESGGGNVMPAPTLGPFAATTRAFGNRGICRPRACFRTYTVTNTTKLFTSLPRLAWE